MSRKSKRGRREYQRKFMAKSRAEKRQKVAKGGIIGGVGKGRIHKGGEPEMLVPMLVPKREWDRLQERVMLLERRSTETEATLVLLEALVRQAEEWGN